jgi:3-keto-disaccharide hydrolase
MGIFRQLPLIALLFFPPATNPQASSSSAVGEAGFVPLFNGKDLTGWEGDRTLWLVENGMIVGRSQGIKNNDFLNTTRTFGDFELRLLFHLIGGKGNSGIQFRSRKIPGHVSGYQADIGEKYWGCLYDEARRDKVLVQAPAELDTVLKKEGWNDYVIRAQGDHIQLWVNGLKTVDYRETDPAIERNGIISLQLHSGGPLEVQFKNLRIKELK